MSEQVNKLVKPTQPSKNSLIDPDREQSDYEEGEEVKASSSQFKISSLQPGCKDEEIKVDQRSSS